MRSAARRRTAGWLAVPALPVALVIALPASATAAPVPLSAPRNVAASAMDGGHPGRSGDMSSLFPSDGEHATHDAGAGGDRGHETTTGGPAGHTAGEDHAGHNPATTDPHGGHQGVPEGTSTGGHQSGPEGGHGGGHGSSEPPADRPKALVLGGFGVLNAAVLASAAVLRRRGAADRRRRSRTARLRAAAPAR